MRCQVSKCTNDVHAKGLCKYHYYAKRHKDKYVPRGRNNVEYPYTCSVCNGSFVSTSPTTKTCPDHRAIANRFSRHGIDVGIATDMLIAQDFKCIGCMNEIGLGDSVVDHDHSHCSGKAGCQDCVRSLMCHQCNTALGLLQESPERLLRLHAYAIAISRPPMLESASQLSERNV